MKPHYFEQTEADKDDLALSLAKGQGYVPSRCLLGGHVVMGLVNAGKKPCAGCKGPRDKCGGPVSAVAS